jgi:hypothetical protein
LIFFGKIIRRLEMKSCAKAGNQKFSLLKLRPTTSFCVLVVVVLCWMMIVKYVIPQLAKAASGVAFF